MSLPSDRAASFLAGTAAYNPFAVLPANSFFFRRRRRRRDDDPSYCSPFSIWNSIPCLICSKDLFFCCSPTHLIYYCSVNASNQLICCSFIFTFNSGREDAPTALCLFLQLRLTSLDWSGDESHQFINATEAWTWTHSEEHNVDHPCCCCCCWWWPSSSEWIFSCHWCDVCSTIIRV